MEGINVPQTFFGQEGSFSPWHIEDKGMFSINYHHGGDTKYWVV
jgi:hypothetical protein